jgi:hypothetical protein
MDTGPRSIVFVASETRFRLPTNVGHVHEVSRSIGVNGKIQRSIRLDAMEQAWNKDGMMLHCVAFEIKSHHPQFVMLLMLR